MSKRLQVLLEDIEMAGLRAAAEGQQMTVAEWVRQALRKAMREQPVYDVRKKIEVVREAARHNYPAGEMDDMLREIDRGRQDGLEP